MKLNHIAIIPDGNRRWAKAHRLPTFKGHEKGMANVEYILREARRMNIPYVTAWGCSRDNVTKRSISEIRFLYNIFEKNFNKMLTDEEIHKNKVRVRVIGEWPKFFPSGLRKSIRAIEEATKTYNKFHLTFLMAYDGKREMAEAIRRAQKSSSSVSESNLKNYLWTKDLPPVDLVIRSGESGNFAHWSAGFLMWHTADSEFYFTKTTWPAFSAKEFRKAIKLYEKRPRNKGK